jgi:uncharacterized membrane protein YgdD (TMEM256/DUF423 family)
MEPRIWLALAALWGFMGVGGGAFGAHGLDDPKAKALLETGGHYQLIHALAVFACFAALKLLGARTILSAWLFLAGSLIFSGRLYLMALGAPRILGAVTPIGGVLILAGWLTLAWACYTARSKA